MKSTNIIFIGLPGSGKSTVGKALANHLDLPFLDLDSVMERVEGMSIPEIFSNKGEAYFRDLEAACLRKVLEEPVGKVLATGGGVPCFHGNMEVILQKGLSVYLEVPFTELAERLFAEGVEKRPLLQGVKDPEALVPFLEEKFSYRIPFYKKATLNISNTSGKTPEELVYEIQGRLEKQ